MIKITYFMSKVVRSLQHVFLKYIKSQPAVDKCDQHKFSRYSCYNTFDTREQRYTALHSTWCVASDVLYSNILEK